MTLKHVKTQIELNNTTGTYFIPEKFIQIRSQINKQFGILNGVKESERGKQIVDIKQSVEMIDRLLHDIDPSTAKELYETQQANETNFDSRKNMMIYSYQVNKSSFDSLRNGWYKKLIDKTPAIIFELDTEFKDIQSQLQILSKEVDSFVIPAGIDISAKEDLIKEEKGKFNQKLNHIVNDLTVPWQDKLKKAKRDRLIDAEFFTSEDTKRNTLQKRYLNLFSH